MKVRKAHVTQWESSYVDSRGIRRYRRPMASMTPTTITIHNTSNKKSTAQNERDWLKNPSNKRTASWHRAVDDKEVVEAIPLNEVAYHAGDATGNRTSIGIEICESGDRDKTWDNAVTLVAQMLDERGWGVDRLRRHYDWSGKDCPRLLNRGVHSNWRGWTWFKNRVQVALDELQAPTVPEVDPNEPAPWAENAWNWATNRNILDGKRPTDAITRQEVAVLLQNVFGRVINQYAKEKPSKWAEPSLEVANEIGLSLHERPLQFPTREELAVVVDKVLQEQDRKRH